MHLISVLFIPTFMVDETLLIDSQKGSEIEVPKLSLMFYDASNCEAYRKNPGLAQVELSQGCYVLGRGPENQDLDWSRRIVLPTEDSRISRDQLTLYVPTTIERNCTGYNFVLLGNIGKNRPTRLELIMDHSSETTFSKRESRFKRGESQEFLPGEFLEFYDLGIKLIKG